MEETTKISSVVNSDHLKYRTVIDAITSITNNKDYSALVANAQDNAQFVLSKANDTSTILKENSLTSVLSRLGVNTKDNDLAFPSLTPQITNVNSMVGTLGTVDPIYSYHKPDDFNKRMEDYFSFASVDSFGTVKPVSNRFINPMEVDSFGTVKPVSNRFINPMEDGFSLASVAKPIGEIDYLFTRPNEDSITAILGKFNYPSLLTKENDFLAITAKGYNFDNLQKVNYFLGDVATSAIQAVNGKFDNYSLVNVGTQVTKDLISIDFQKLNKLADGFLEWIEKIKNEVKVLIDEFEHYLLKEGILIPKSENDFFDFWFGYNEKYLGLSRENRNNFKLHEHDLFLYHSCREVKFKMRLDTMEEAFDIVWKTVDKRNQKLLQPSPVAPLLESNKTPKTKAVKETKVKNPISAVAMAYAIKAIEDYTNERFIPTSFIDKHDKFQKILNKIKSEFGEEYNYEVGTLMNGFSTCQQKDITDKQQGEMLWFLKEFKYVKVAKSVSNNEKCY